MSKPRPESAATLMSSDYIALAPGMQALEALQEIRRVGLDRKNIYTCYVTQQGKLLGILSAKRLLLAEERALVQDLMQESFIAVQKDEDQEVVAQLLQAHKLLALPVINKQGHMLGIVSFDDAMGVLDLEVTEDMRKMAAIAASEAPYLQHTVWEHVKQRVPWLLFLMLSATFTGLIIQRYEAALSALPILVSFLPMLMDTGGNCGAQSSTLIIRGLATQRLQSKDALRIAWMEFRVALCVSGLLSLANGLRIYLMEGDWRLALTVCLSLIATILLAKMTGALLPLFAQRLGFDPALMAAPLITTIVDSIAILFYFFFATLLLGG